MELFLFGVDEKKQSEGSIGGWPEAERLFLARFLYLDPEANH